MEAKKVIQHEVMDSEEIFEGIISFPSFLCDVVGEEKIEACLKKKLTKRFWGESLLLYLAILNNECGF
jgi:hypothetical protein